ncbi:H/ACA ribonucleoprotein complex non-core subunit NAF1 isoform X1 [Pseudomyrmex gracilis]|uniref:H/ACA ribonucleoprotein complex non-core subunit NAF1 isoform X1 n=1 Tax=Pseudomyrmex gracilis TaxID=219809 RepID=UPI0009957727|nr:H/ACA ribonucleoprotein complex non-core subunit NAF1 isoform X1 [Pseudomyrmex gracilis]
MKEIFTYMMSQKIKETSLNIIALEYGSSDSDVEEKTNTLETNIPKDTENVEAINKISVEQNSVKHDLNYRNVEEISSSEVSDSEDDSEDSDSSSTDTSSSENESDVPHTNSNKKKENFKEKKHNNECDYLPPLENLNLSVPEVSCELLGKIQKIVEEVVVIEPLPDKPRLDIDTILFINQGRQSLGRIFDVYGKVSEPYYCVRFNSSEHTQKSDIVDKPVYYCPNKKEYTSLIFLHELTKIKACDPVGDDESPDFSSDEEETTYYAQLSTKKNNNGPNDRSYKRRRTSGPVQNRENNLQANHLRNQTTSNNQNITSFNVLPRYSYQSNTWSYNMRHTHSNPYISLPRPFFAPPRFNYHPNYPIFQYNVRPYMWHMNPHGLNSQSLLPPPPPPPLLPPTLPLPPCHSTNNSGKKPQ